MGGPRFWRPRGCFRVDGCGVLCVSRDPCILIRPARFPSLLAHDPAQGRPVEFAGSCAPRRDPRLVVGGIVKAWEPGTPASLKEAATTVGSTPYSCRQASACVVLTPEDHVHRGGMGLAHSMCSTATPDSEENGPSRDERKAIQQDVVNTKLAAIASGEKGLGKVRYCVERHALLSSALDKKKHKATQTHTNTHTHTHTHTLHIHKRELTRAIIAKFVTQYPILCRFDST
jgi:hypothetical protein